MSICKKKTQITKTSTIFRERVKKNSIIAKRNRSECFYLKLNAIERMNYSINLPQKKDERNVH